MESYTDEEEMDEVILDEEIYRFWRTVSKENRVEIDDKKVIINTNSWGVYTNKKQSLIKVGYSVEVSGYYGKKLLSGELDDHVVKEPK